MTTKAKSYTSASRFTRVYAIMIIVIVMLTSLSILTVVGYRLLDDKRDYSTDVIQTLKNATTNGDVKWRFWESNYDVNTNATFVAVRTTSNGTTLFHHVTKGTKTLTSHPLHALTRSGQLVYQRGSGLYFKATATRRATVHGQPVTVHYTVWQSLDRVVRMFVIIIELVIIILILSLVIGVWIISQLSKRLNQPLTALTDSTQDLIQKPKQSYHETLTVPANPEEVQELGDAFNTLLGSLNDTILKNQQFISDASHELRTPIAVILGHTELLEKHAADHPEIIQESVGYIDDEAHQMQELVTSLLALSRSTKAEAELTTVDVVPIIRTVVAQYQQGQQVVTQLPDRLLIHANAGQVQQILTALIDNARKYSPTASTVTVSAQQESAETVAITVADQGIGISDADKEKIFDRFYRADQSRSKQVAGYGIGLAIVRQLVELNDATVVVKDNQPAGSCFVVRFKSV